MKSVASVCCFLVLLASAGAHQMTGQKVTFSPRDNDPTLLFAMKGINDHYKDKKDTAARVLVTVLEASKQVVDGELYTYKLEISGGPTGNEICTVTVWSRPWLDDDKLGMTIPSFSCQKRSKPYFLIRQIALKVWLALKAWFPWLV